MFDYDIFDGIDIDFGVSDFYEVVDVIGDDLYFEVEKIGYEKGKDEEVVVNEDEIEEDFYLRIGKLKWEKVENLEFNGDEEEFYLENFELYEDVEKIEGDFDIDYKYLDVDKEEVLCLMNIDGINMDLSDCRCV